MSKNLYITATESRSGKSAIVLGVMQMLLRDIRRVGFFRPIISDDSDRKDHDIDLVLSQFYLGLRYEETYALTMKQAKDLVNAGQQALLASGADISADVLVVPHHGSSRLDAAFVAAVGASVALIQVGQDNDYGHPAQRALRILQASGAQVFRTDQQGAIAVSRDGARVITQR